MFVVTQGINLKKGKKHEKPENQGKKVLTLTLNTTLMLYVVSLTSWIYGL